MKGAKFNWDKRREEAYSYLLNIMSSITTFRPFVMDRPTHFVSDASPEGIQASLYQEQEDRTWVPVVEGKRIGIFQRNNPFRGTFCFLLTE